MAPRPTTAAVEPGPIVPALPRTEPALVQYLRSFELWIRNGFQERPPTNTALSGVLLAASDATPGTNAKVFMLTVDSTGTLHTTSVPLGGGLP